MAEKTSIEKLHDIKRHLDNGFNGEQTAIRLDVSTGLISRLQNGHYGKMPNFPPDTQLKKELRWINLEKLNNKIRGKV